MKRFSHIVTLVLWIVTWMLVTTQKCLNNLQKDWQQTKIRMALRYNNLIHFMMDSEGSWCELRKATQGLLCAILMAMPVFGLPVRNLCAFTYQQYASLTGRVQANKEAAKLEAVWCVRLLQKEFTDKDTALRNAEVDGQKMQAERLSAHLADARAAANIGPLDLFFSRGSSTIQTLYWKHEATLLFENPKQLEHELMASPEMRCFLLLKVNKKPGT